MTEPTIHSPIEPKLYTVRTGERPWVEVVSMNANIAAESYHSFNGLSDSDEVEVCDDEGTIFRFRVHRSACCIEAGLAVGRRAAEDKTQTTMAQSAARGSAERLRELKARIQAKIDEQTTDELKLEQKPPDELKLEAMGSMHPPKNPLGFFAAVLGSLSGDPYARGQATAHLARRALSEWNREGKDEEDEEKKN